MSTRISQRFLALDTNLDPKLKPICHPLEVLAPPMKLSRTHTQSLRPDASDELETALRTTARAHQYLRAEMLMDPQEAGPNHNPNDNPNDNPKTLPLTVTLSLPRIHRPQ